MMNFSVFMWLILNLLFYVIFSVNILISLLSFVMLIGIMSILLLSLHIEYVAYVLLLIYLGGVIIFFLFLILLLHNESSLELLKKGFSFDTALLLILFFKLFFVLSLLNERIVIFFIKSQSLYNPSYITNNIFITDLLEVHGDVSYFVSIFSSSNYNLLVVLGLILLFSMIGIIMITKQTDA